MRKLRDNDANNLDRLRATVAQTLCNDIPKEMMFFCKGLDSLAFLLADAGAVFQCARHRSHRNTKLAGYIFHRYRRSFFHGW